MNASLLFITLVLSLYPVLAVSEEHEEWYAFKITHNKRYETKPEESDRFKIFKRNLKKIEEHNKLFEQGLVSYRKGVNQFSDLTKEEFITKYHKYSVPKTVRKSEKLLKKNTEYSLPSEVDWRTKDAVTPVKNQGACGSAVTFSVIGAIEGALAIKSGHLKALDEKNLINCTGIIEGGGCYKKAVGSFEKNIGTCLYYDSDDDEMETYNFVDVLSGSEDDLQEAVALYCPVSVAIDATDLQFYTTGTFYDAGCSGTQVNHAVLVVGYGTDDDGKDYWLMKNSWGSQWGEDGYARLARNAENNCGIATYAAYPVL